MRELVIYVKYVVIPAIVIIAAIWIFHIAVKIKKWLLKTLDTKNRR